MGHQTTVFALIIVLFAIYTLEYQITSDINRVIDTTNNNDWESVARQKRQLENFDTDETISQDEEEPGFWDRVIKVAVKLFNKFIEWLNSS